MTGYARGILLFRPGKSASIDTIQFRSDIVPDMRKYILSSLPQQPLTTPPRPSLPGPESPPERLCPVQILLVAFGAKCKEDFHERAGSFDAVSTGKCGTAFAAGSAGPVESAGPAGPDPKQITILEDYI